MAMEILKEVSADEQLRTRIRFQEKAENDRMARLYYARQEGQHDKALEIAIKALDMLNNESIVQLTGLSLEEVTALRATKEKQVISLKIRE